MSLYPFYFKAKWTFAFHFRWPTKADLLHNKKLSIFYYNITVWFNYVKTTSDVGGALSRGFLIASHIPAIVISASKT